MGEPPTVAVSEVIAKLSQIETLAPRCAGDTMTYRLMRYMASSEATYLRAGETLFPETFLMTFTTILGDAENGVNSLTGGRFPRTIANMSPFIYELVRYDLPVIADAIFPPLFAADVKHIYASVKAELALRRPAPAKKSASKRR